MLEVGFSASEATTSWPDEMPPSTPPASFFKKPRLVISSRCSVPRWDTERKPAPISTPLTALIDISAWAMSASSRSNTGSPHPGGTPAATTSTFAPTESPSLDSRCMYASSSGTWAGFGQKNGLSSAAAASCTERSSSIGPSWERCPRTRVPKRSASTRLAIAPPATRIAVSRAEERPPPRWSRRPYFIW